MNVVKTSSIHIHMCVIPMCLYYVLKTTFTVTSMHDPLSDCPEALHVVRGNIAKEESKLQTYA